MNYNVLLKNLLGILKLGNYEIANEALLSKAANWALNCTDFKFSNYNAIPLRPILATLKGNETKLFRKAEKLCVEVTMPSDDRPDTLKYFNDFRNALKESREDSLLTTLENYASTLAVNEKYNDISLFEFIKATIGIAKCLEVGNGKLRLAGGSISGIQTYLYEIISKNAAKLLKGRSFYIQLLVDSALDELITEFKLSSCHVVYSSGGGFYVFIPESLTLEDDFSKFSQKVSEVIYKKHKIALSLDLALTKPFEETAKINMVWDELFANLNKLKFKRLNNNPALLKDFFEKVEVGGVGETNRDPITNEEFGADETSFLPDNVKVLKSTKQQIDLGKKLRGAELWITSKDKFLGEETIKDPFGKFHYLEKDLPKRDLTSRNILTFNGRYQNINSIFYGGNNFPHHSNGDIRAFDELVKHEKFERLAILRMDVDGLGAIFSEERQISSSTYGLNWLRYVAVSRSLDLFFKGYLNELQREVELEIKAIDTSVIIYSGGDDLFFVGRWDTIIALSEAIYKKFKDWTNGVLTISGGIEILPSKFPIMQGAKMTAKSEHKAKNHVIKIGNEVIEKNSITLFGKPFNWEHEFSIVNELQDKIYKFITSENIEIKPRLDKSIIGKINLHADSQRNYFEKKLTNEPVSPQWMWLIAYDFSQIISRTKDEDAKKFIKELQLASVSNQYEGKEIKSKYPFLQILQLAARWAEMRYRSNN